VTLRFAVLSAAFLGWIAPATLRAADIDNSIADEYLNDEKTPPLPPGISAQPVVISGVYAYAWKLTDGTNVLSIYGDFSLKMGDYKLRSRDAVVWFRTTKWEAVPYLDMEVFLWQDAEVVQPAGTTETGPALLVSLASAGKLELLPGSHTMQSDEGSPLYERASTVRASIEKPGPEEPTSAPATPVQTRGAEGGLIRPLRASRPPRQIDYSGRDLSSEVVGERRVVIVIGDVRVGSREGPSAEAMELRADSAVLFLSESATAESLAGVPGAERKKKPTTQASETAAPPSAAEEPLLSGRGKSDRQSAREFVSSAYLEGDVVLTRGTRMIRAPKMYYDFEADRALALDVVMRAFTANRDVPIYVRAEQVRQLSESEYFARRAKLTTSEFAVPHVALGTERVYITDRTPRNERGEIIGIQAGSYKAYDTTMQVNGVPVLYWPVAQGDFSEDTMAFKGIRTGYNNRFGAVLETRWYLFNLLGLQKPEGFDSTLKLDYFSKRGPGVGIDTDYVRENYYGLLRSYYIHDDGKDALGPLRSGYPPTEDRGRVLWRHRQYLPEDWQLTLETSYLSDPNFLESYYRNEFQNGKDQETVVYLLKRKENWQFSTLANWRLNYWIALTEHYPDVVFSLIGEPLADFVTFYSEQRASVVKYLQDNRRVFDDEDDRADNTGNTGSDGRVDAREELRIPIPELGPVKITPYVMGRDSAWSDTPHDGGAQNRIFGAVGATANMYLERTYDDVESELLNVHRLRHIIKPEVNVWGAADNLSSNDISPFDPGIETIDDFSGVTLGARQRWQTKRGGPGRWRTVDWIILDVEAGFFTHPRDTQNSHGDFIFSRPEDSISSNFLATNLTYRISESTALVYDAVWDLNRGQTGVMSVSLNVERDPRLSYFVGYRYINETQDNLIGFGGNYRLNEKYTFAFREYYDIYFERNYSTQISLIQRWPRWYTGVTFDFDNSIDEYGVSLSIWPEGAPNFALGNRRLTGVAESVGIRP